MSLHFLPFGSVVRVKVGEQELDLMVVDWVVKPEGADYFDYLGVVWPRGFFHVEGDEKTYQKVPFNAEDIQLVRFIGLSHFDFEEKDNKSFEIAKEKGLSIARLFEEDKLHAFDTPAKFRVAKELPRIVSREDASQDYYPIGTVATVNARVGEAGEIAEKDVMIIAFGPDYFKNKVDYQIIPWKGGFCGVDFPLGVNEDDIVSIKSLGFVNAEVQFLVNSHNRNNEEREGE